MDILGHYSTYTPARATTGQGTVNRANVKCMSASEFLEMARSQGVKAPERSKFLYNGSETRARLSDTEIAVLANKYDPHDMDQETYDSFLDDLESMGAISNMEKQQLGYHGIQMIGYMGEDGNWVLCGSPSGVWALPEGAIKNDECIFTPWGEETDIYKWLGERTQQELVAVFDPSGREPAEAYEGLLKNMFKVVDRMQARRDTDAKAAEKAGLRRQIADPNSAFYANMLLDLTENVEKTKEDREQQAIVDALGAVLDALSGKTDASGSKASVNKSASELTRKIGERINELDPEDPERIRLEQMLAQLQEMGIYFDIGGMDDLWQDEEETFETLTQLLTRRQAEEINSAHPNKNEVNQTA